MGCVYSDFDGTCSLQSTDEVEEACVYEDDPNPSDGCCDYESDYTCSECGNDLMVEDCGCENE